MTPADRTTLIRRVGFVVAAVAVGMVIGAFLSGGFSRPPRVATQPVGADTGTVRVGAGPAGPSAQIGGVGVGFSHNRDGAVAAATNLVLALEQAGNTDRDAALRAYRMLAADASKDQLASEMAASWDSLHKGITDNGPNHSTLFLRTVPVGHDVVRYTDDRATVQVWTLTIVAANGLRQPVATWETASVEVVWEHDDWKVWSADSTAGPAPAWADAPVTATDAFLSAVNQLEGYRYATS